MSSDTIEIGGIYVAKVSGRTIEVRIDREYPKGGWEATSLSSNKKIRLTASQSLRAVAKAEEEPQVAEVAQQVAVEAPAEQETQPAPEPAPTPAPAPEPTPAPVPEPVASNEDLVPLATVMGTKKKGRPATAAAPKAKATKPKADEPTPKVAATPASATKGLSCLDAAATVLKASGKPMSCKEMIEAMAAAGLWKSKAPTPHATLYSAILREMTTKGANGRFKKTDRGQFTLNLSL